MVESEQWCMSQMSSLREQKVRSFSRDLIFHQHYVSLYIYICISMCLMCIVLSPIWLFATPWTVAHQFLCPWYFSRQEYWLGCLFFLQGIFPTHGSNLSFLKLQHCRQILYHWVTRKVQMQYIYNQMWRNPKSKWDISIQVIT